MVEQTPYSSLAKVFLKFFDPIGEQESEIHTLVISITAPTNLHLYFLNSMNDEPISY